MAEYESIMNMNENTGKHARWLLRILDPDIIPYEFTARNETIQASRFSCVCVSDNPAEYMHGVVPFQFANRDAPQSAVARFQPNTVWEITKPAFDNRAKVEFNGAPMKQTLLLCAPTTCRAISPTDTDNYNKPARFICPPLTLKDILGLKRITMPKRAQAPAPGSATNRVSVPTRAVDFAAKLLSISSGRQVVKAGKPTTVHDAEVADDSLISGKHAKCTISVWGSAKQLLDNVAPGTGFVVLGCSAGADQEGNIKIHMNANNARVILGGHRATHLTQFVVDDSNVESVTSTWTPSHEPISVDGTAVFACCAGMASLAASSCASYPGDVIFQVNRAMIHAPTTDIHTQDGARLFLRATLRDWSGPVEVGVTESAAPTVYGLCTVGEVEEALRAERLSVIRRRVNVRGVRRVEDHALKYYVAEIVDCPNVGHISQTAMRASLGLASIQGDVIVPAPISAIVQCPFLGFALEQTDGRKVGAHRAIVVVAGTRASNLQQVSEGSQAYLVESKNVRCLLSDTEVFANLRGYCDFDSLLQYRLDTEEALVTVSNITVKDDEKCLTIDYMMKIPSQAKADIINSLKEEWAVVASPEAPATAESEQILATPDSGRKVRRITREPTTPTR